MTIHHRDNPGQPPLSNDLAFRAHALRAMSNAALAALVNDRENARGHASYWTGSGVYDYGRTEFIASILRAEGFNYAEVKRVMSQ